MPLAAALTTDVQANTESLAHMGPAAASAPAAFCAYSGKPIVLGARPPPESAPEQTLFRDYAS